MDTLWNSSKYKRFVEDRNKAIEQINLHTQTDLSRLLFEALERVTHFVSHMGLEGKITIYNLEYLTRQFDAYVWQQFNQLLPLLLGRIQRMRKATYMLTYLSELEAIARATKRTKPLSVAQFKSDVAKQMHQDTILGQQWDARIWQILAKLRHTLLDAFRRAIASERTPLEVSHAVQSAYPRIAGFRKPPRALKPLRESDKKKLEDEQEFDFYGNLIDENDWEFITDLYKDTELPPSRFDQNPQFDPEAGYYRYNWELEQDVTDDFVSRVRAGQVQAANDLGVKDFVWVAIIDNKVCEECCLPRNGKTSSEIEKMLATKELDKEHCDAVVPPAHPNCRCDIAPVASTDEVEGPDWKQFQDWLDDKYIEPGFASARPKG